MKFIKVGKSWVLSLRLCLGLAVPMSGQPHEEAVRVEEVKAKYRKEAISRLLVDQASNFLRRGREQSGAGNTSWIL